MIIIYYYAIYHATLALIASKNLISKSHLATLNSLILFFYHQKKIKMDDVEIVANVFSKSIKKEDIRLIIQTKRLRERASYNVGYNFEDSLAKTAKNNAQKFIEKTRDILEI